MGRFIQRKENTEGRDFVVVDIHGQFDLLMQRLKEVSFDTTIDRLFVGGDIVDRGKRTLDCLRLIREPWFNYVLGNHELMLLWYFGLWSEGHHEGYDYFRTDGSWLQDLTQLELKELVDDLLPMLREAPFVMAIAHKRLPFQIAHAELIDGWGELITPLKCTDEYLMRNHSEITWSRNILREANIKSTVQLLDNQKILISRTPWEPALPLTYVGHSIIEVPVLHRSHFFVDRGAFLRAKNSAYDLLLLEHDKVATTLLDV